ncbi:DUF1822 family protein [Alkalinema sp. FACHB-956]|uniref:DUF1822 family protein n=1 Tax=Alkalinema sp. FACHB-956 TaxID=2692768 RepID=UPI001688ECE0|nr:DUF1822 family protein [Alkalinema sp. FACHB-956]MBD2327531.1 DUF1822 family protein [Alkalinema sp. FACHB-956]
MSLHLESPTELILAIPQTVRSQAEHQSQGSTDTAGQWRLFLNHLSLQTILPWLRSEYFPQATAFPNVSNPSNVWAWVNGAGIQVGQKRLILLPDRSVDTSELVVPQEWVDAPDWLGDYFLAVQVNLEESCVDLWGYATHEMLKTHGRYEADDRTYHLDREFLVSDISVLWVVQQLAPNEVTQAAIAPLATVEAVQAENLLQRLGNATNPRLEIPFSLWGSLITQDVWRQRLYQLRQNFSVDSIQANLQQTLQQSITRLGQWFQNQFETGWQTLEELQLQPAIALRDGEETVEIVRRVKALRLADQVVLLLVAITPEADQRVMVQIQLRPIAGVDCLPENLALSLVTPEGETVQTVQARSADNVIQLQRFRCPIETAFAVQVTLEQTTVMESFIA